MELETEMHPRDWESVELAAFKEHRSSILPASRPRTQTWPDARAQGSAFDRVGKTT